MGPMLTTSLAINVIGNAALAAVLLYGAHRLAVHLHARTERERIEQAAHPDESDRAALRRMYETHRAERTIGRAMWTE
jgi:hypothetical protein